MRKFYFLLVFVFGFCFNFGQTPITVSPTSFGADDVVTITFDKSKGNQGLNAYSGDVYFYSGIITPLSINNSDWKFPTPCNWNNIYESEKMTNLGGGLYQIKIIPRAFYQIPNGQTINKLVMLFRDNKPNLVGREVGGGDIIYTLPTPAPVNAISATVVKLSDQSLKVTFSTGSSVRYVPYHDNLLKVEYSPRGESINNSTSVALTPSSSISATLTSDATDYIYTFGNKTIKINKTTFNTAYYKDGILVTKEAGGFSFTSTSGCPNRDRTISLELTTNEQIYGLGSKGILTQNRRGKVFDMFGKQTFGYPGAGTETNDLNVAIPLMISNKNYGLYFDHEYLGNANIGVASANEMRYSITDGNLSYFLVFGNNQAEVLSNYTILTGKQPLPPRWSLGYLQSKYGYQNTADVTGIVNELKTNGFPLDGIILDLFWFGGTNKMGDLNWDSTRFASPTSMISDLKTQGIKTILITETYVTNQSNNWSNANTNKRMVLDKDNNTFAVPNMGWLGATTVGMLDIFKSSSKDWMWNFYNSRIAEGVEGFWCDLGEPEHSDRNENEMHNSGTATLQKVHNRYSLEWIKMLHEKYQANYPTKRPMNLIRAGNAGMQRFGALPWSGDIERSWDGLRLQIPIMLGMGMSGSAYMHSDVGGFMGGVGRDNELFSRWVQMGIFSPIFRIHSDDHNADFDPEPTKYNATTRDIAKKFIKLRYDLLPYNYSLCFENSLTGIPLARPMNFYEDTTSLQNKNDQHFWGSNIIVAPILNAGVTSRSVQLPAGNWYNYWTRASHTGNASVTINAAIDSSPILIKEGSFIPKSLNLDSTEGYNSQNLTIEYYPSSSNSEYKMYNDDGNNPNSITSSSYETITMSAYPNGLDSKFTFNSVGSYTGKPTSRNIIFYTFNVSVEPLYVLANTTRLTKVASKTLLDTTLNSYYYNTSTQELYANTTWSVSSEHVIKFKLCTDSTTWNGLSWTNGIPSSTKSAIINGAYNFNASSPQGSFTSCSCSIDGINLSISSGTYLESISDVKLLNGATLTIENGGNFVQRDDKALTPNITLNTLTRPIHNHTWVHRTSPILNNGSIWNSIPFGNYDPNNASQPTNQYRTGSLYTLSNSAWVNQTNDSNLIPGRGFIIRTTGQRFTNSPLLPSGNTNNTTTATRPLNFVGTANNGNYQIPLHSDGITGTSSIHTALGDQNLVGNPYPSTIDANDFLTANSSNIFGTIYIWTSPMIGHDGKYPHSSGFATYNGTMGVASGTDATFIPSRFIAPGQGFQVFSTCSDCTSLNLNFTNDMRRTTETGGRKFARKKEQNNEKVYLSLKDNTTSLTSRIGIGYVEGATQGFDKMYDAPSISFELFKFFSKINDEKVIINGKPKFNVEDTVELGMEFENSIQRTLELKLEKSEGDAFEKGVSIFLKDKLLNVNYNLTVNKSYNFSCSEKEVLNRFEIFYSKKNAKNSRKNESSETLSSTIATIENTNLYIKSVKEINQIDIFDLVGRLIKTLKVENKEVITTLSGNKTLYIIKIQYNDGSYESLNVLSK